MNPISKADLAQFTGTSHYYLHTFNNAVISTEGIQYLAENAECYWLIDAIASHLASRAFNEAAKHDERIGLLHFWKLAVHDDRSATLKAVADSGEPAFIQQEIPFTDFPFDDIDVWAGRDSQYWVLMLPSERASCHDAV